MARKKLAQTLSSRPITQAGEIVLVFAAALAVIRIAGPLAGEDRLARQGVVWVANVVMLAIVWLGLRLRGQRRDHLGLAIRPADARSVFRTIVSSFGVFLAAVAAFLLGAIVTALVVGQPEPADFSGYNYLAGNLPLLLLALGGVYIVSSFGEEVTTGRISGLSSTEGPFSDPRLASATEGPFSDPRLGRDERCGVLASVVDGRAVRIEGNPDQPLTKGRFCARGNAGVDLLWEVLSGSARNEGWVSVGIDHDTASFAVHAIRRRWTRMGRDAYPDTPALPIRS